MLKDKYHTMKEIREKDYSQSPIDLDCALFVDTYLVVRYQYDGQDKWTHYINHIIQSNGQKRTYRTLYTYFAKLPNFIAAYGYVLYDDPLSESYEASFRYFRFDKIHVPRFSFKKLPKPFFFKKPWAR